MEINFIKFTESHSFIGEEMTMTVNGKHHRLELGEWGGYAEHGSKRCKI